jgi:hypothetical protein
MKISTSNIAFCLFMISNLLARSEGESNLIDKENLRYGPSFIDENKNFTLYSDLNKIGEKTKIDKLSDLLKCWAGMTSNSSKERYISAVAINEHLKRNGIVIKSSVKAIIQDSQSEQRVALVKELSLQLETVWEVKHHLRTDK